MNRHFVGFEFDGAIGVVQVKIMEIILHHLGLEPQAKDKPFEAVPGINLHDVPQNRMLADGHHRFGTKLGFLFDPRAQSATKDEHGHCRQVVFLAHSNLASGVCLRSALGA